MKIFPAIDIKDKKCVRLIKGDFSQKTEYQMSPVEQATQFIDKGFKNLHIVDLDGALAGETVNLDIIKEIVSKFDFKVEVGGGVRDFDSIQEYADIGVDKVILGSAAIKDKTFLKKACKKFPKKIALGLDAKDGRTDKYLRRLEALMAIGDKEKSFIISGTGDVLEPEGDVIGIGSGGNYALAAAKVLMDTELNAEEVAKKFY